MKMDIVENYVSKCNRLIENKRYIKAIKVLFRLRIKQNITSFPLKLETIKIA